MDENTFRLCLFLILIKFRGEQDTSYELIKTLAWHFKIIDFIEVSNNATTNGFTIKVEQPNRTHKYTITPSGLDYLKTIGEASFIDELDKRYSNPLELVTIYRTRFIEHFPK